jgi:hypothetical protein
MKFLQDLLTDFGEEEEDEDEIEGAEDYMSIMSGAG